MNTGTGGEKIPRWWAHLRHEYFKSADAYINHRPAENLTVMRQRRAILEAHHIACPEPAPDDPRRRAYDELGRILAKPLETSSWDDIQQAQMHFVHLVPMADLPALIDQNLGILRKAGSARGVVLRNRWKEIENAVITKQIPDIEAGGARGLLKVALEEVQTRATENYLKRKLGAIYAFRLVVIFFLALLFGVAMVVWEVYFRSFPLREAKFSGFAMALVAGLLGASFSALLKQGTVKDLDGLEEVRTAIGIPMIILRLGVGVSAAAILYFFFESGLVESVVFPDLTALAFDPVINPTIVDRNGGEDVEETVAVLLSGDNRLFLAAEELTHRISEAREAAGAATAKLDEMVRQAGARTVNGAAARVASNSLITANAQLDSAMTLLQGERSVALGRFVPNPALSLLVVWSFLAGFSQTLVPNILAKLEEGGGKSSSAGWDD